MYCNVTIHITCFPCNILALVLLVQEAADWVPCWTTKSPSANVLRRLSVVAADAFKALLAATTSAGARSTAALVQAFTPELNDFHVLLRLREAQLPRPDGRHSGSVEAYRIEEWLVRSNLLHAGSASRSTHGKTVYSVPMVKESREMLLRGFQPLAAFVQVFGLGVVGVLCFAVFAVIFQSCGCYCCC